MVTMWSERTSPRRYQNKITEWKESKKRGGGRTRRKTKIIKIDEEEEKKRNKILYMCTHINTLCVQSKRILQYS